MNELELLRASAPRAAGPTADVLAAGRVALLERVHAQEPYDVLPQRRRRRRTLIAPALTAAAALTGVLLLQPADAPEVASPSVTAAQFLLASAEQVEQSTDDAALAQAQWWYVRSRVDGTQSDVGIREIWLGRTEPGRVLYRPTSGNSARGFDEPLQEPASFHGLSWDDLSELPTDTTALRARVYEIAATGGSSRDGQAFVVVGDLLRESPAPADVRAALLRVVATVPGVELEPRTVDSEGRTVVPVALEEPDGSLVTRLMVDPDTGALLGEEVAALRALTADQVGTPVEAGTVLHRMTLLDSAPVPGRDARP